MSVAKHQLIDGKDGRVILSELEIANTFWKRFVGLQFRRSLSASSGMLLDPCSSLHTCFMRFPIDIFMLDKVGTVMAIRKSVRPWRAVVCARGTIRIVETAVGATDLPVGTRLQVKSS